MNSKNTRRLMVSVGVLVLAVIGFEYIRPSQPGQQDTKTNGNVNALFQNQSRAGLGQSADKVNASVQWTVPATAAGPGKSLVLRLKIAPGWHVNANPASLQFLIPTHVAAAINNQPVDLKVSYPKGTDSGIHLDGKAIQVYSDGTKINGQLGTKATTLLREAGHLDLKLHVQACSDKGTCLAPSTINIITAPG